MEPIPPDLSSRPFRLTVERTIAAEPQAVFREWTEGIDRWFAAPGTVLMHPRVNAPYFFETATTASAIRTTDDSSGPSPNDSSR